MDLSYSWSQKREYPPFLNILFGSIFFIHEGYGQIFLIKLIGISISSVKHIKAVNWTAPLKLIHKLSEYFFLNLKPKEVQWPKRDSVQKKSFIDFEK